MSISPQELKEIKERVDLGIHHHTGEPDIPILLDHINTQEAQIEDLKAQINGLAVLADLYAPTAVVGSDLIDKYRNEQSVIEAAKVWLRDDADLSSVVGLQNAVQALNQKKGE